MDMFGSQSEMFSLAITEPAAELIRAEVGRSAIKKPVVYLIEIKEGMLSPNSQGGRKLFPCVYSRLHFLGLFLVEVSGIVFFFPPSLKKKASGGTLDIGQGALVLSDRAGRIIMPAQQ
jgi:hypothetical protein